MISRYLKSHDGDGITETGVCPDVHHILQIKVMYLEAKELILFQVGTNVVVMDEDFDLDVGGSGLKTRRVVFVLRSL